MRIAFLSHEPFWPPSGGGSSEALYVVRALRARGHVVDVFCPPGLPPPDQGLRLFHPSFRGDRQSRGRLLHYPRIIRWLEEAVAREHAAAAYDVVFGQGTVAAVAAGRLGRKLGVPCVFNYLDFLTGWLEGWAAARLAPTLLRWLQEYELSLPSRFQPDRVLCISDVLAERFAGRGVPLERLKTIRFGADPALFHRKWREPEDDRPLFVLHSSFDHHHLGTIARDAVLAVHARRPDARFRLIGRETPALRAFVRAVARLIGRGAIETPGFVPYAQVAELLPPSAVAWIPYESSAGSHAAFLGKLPEYLMLGLPVACTRLRAVSEHFADEPLLSFVDFNGTSLADAMVAWVETPLAQRRLLGDRAAERHRLALSWEALAERVADAVEELREAPQTQENPAVFAPVEALAVV